MLNLNLSSGKAYLVSNQNTIRYLTGFTGAAPSFHEAYILLTEKICILYANLLYSENVKRLDSDSNSFITRVYRIQLKTASFSSTNQFYARLRQDCRKYGVRKISYEPHYLSAYEYIHLKDNLTGIKLIPSRNGLNGLRKYKYHSEIKCIRKAASITDACYGYILKRLKPGISESKLAAKIDSYIRNHGAVPAFSPIVAFGTNTSQPHHMPDKTPLSAGDLVLFDLGAKVNGYASDMTRVIFFRKTEKETVKVYQTVLKAQEIVIGALSMASGTAYITNKSAYSGARLDKMAKSVIRKAGYIPYCHGLGHGVGLSIHENPILSQKNDMLVKPGMVFTVEPGIYIPGRFGVRIEDTIYLSEKGLEILTKSPKYIAI
jgi:Xaa-Pro aminopeptidase